MDSALCVLARTGFDGLDLQAVAEETGSGKATVHAHFGSREQLFADNPELTELRNRLTKQVRIRALAALGKSSFHTLHPERRRFRELPCCSYGPSMNTITGTAAGVPFTGGAPRKGGRAPPGFLGLGNED
ncbi:TetR/AcrR family transcriptional regulator [Nocardia abscessus]|uniref:TetR/AcrR family transcriptional regulator n=1 Tax=Nocardia abscessus TaxID=120957 RepID=UPI003CC80119